MKNTLLVLCLLLLAGWRSHAQNTFASPGAEWYYSGTSAFGNEGLYFLLHAKVTGDTLIDGHTCRVIRQEGKEKRGRWQGGTLLWSPETQPDLRSFYVYDSSDTTFIYNERFGKFTPLYIFNVTDGQTICLPVIADETGALFAWPTPDPHPLTGDSSFCYIVDSVRMVLHDTTLLKTVYTRSIYDPYTNGPHPTRYPVQNWSHSGYKSVGLYAQKIGGLRGGLLPKLLYFAELFDGVEPTQQLNLDCYTDSNTRIKRTTKACDYLPPTTLGIKAAGRRTFAGTIYPNPARDRITIRPEAPFGKQVSFCLSDMAGSVLRQGILPAGSMEAAISLARLSAGVYLLSITSDRERAHQAIIVQP